MSPEAKDFLKRLRNFAALLDFTLSIFIMVFRKLLIVSALCFMLPQYLETAFVKAQSTKQNFDFGWKFMEQDASDAADPKYDDSRWAAVDLPHDWDIFHAPAIDAATGNDGGYYPGGIGWYRKTFVSPETTAGDAVKLHFEGVYQKCKVFINGHLAATHAYGYTPFMVDATPYLSKETRNVVAVRVDNSLQPNCRWYSGSGIYRHVWLEVYNGNVIDDPALLHLTTEQVYGISADGTRADSAALRVVYGDRINEVRMYRNVKLWSPKHPNLYDVTVGKLNVKHGFRTIEFDTKNGFRLNGVPTLINGACVHHDDGVIGAMAFDAAEIRKVRLMKEAGFNLIRTAHNPATRAFLDACDSLGMMVIGEIYDGWYKRKTTGDHHLDIDSCYREEIREFITRDRNHPSIISWSIGNEVIERKELRVVHTAKMFRNEVRRWDSTRPVTEALCTWDNDWEIFDPHAEVLDIVGYNYMIHKHESDHIRCPKRVIWQTESYPRDAFGNWEKTNDFPYIIGDIVWTGLDYLGESGIGQFYYEGEPRGEHYNGKHFPFHGAYCGDVDITGLRKPISHYRDMLYNVKEGDTRFIYMAVQEPNNYKGGEISETAWSVWPTWEAWNYTGYEGKKLNVEVYTKAPAVSLYLNDRLIATQAVSRSTEYKATFSVPYEKGALKAVALNADGKEEAYTALTTAGAPYSIRLTPEQRKIKADGEDLAFILAEVIDRNGVVVPDADATMTVSVKGSASLLAAGSASFKDLEPLTSNRVTTYNGRALIVVRAARRPGSASVSVSADLPRRTSATKVVAK